MAESRDIELPRLQLPRPEQLSFVGAGSSTWNKQLGGRYLPQEVLRLESTTLAQTWDYFRTVAETLSWSRFWSSEEEYCNTLAEVIEGLSDPEKHQAGIDLLQKTTGSILMTERLEKEAEKLREKGLGLAFGELFFREEDPVTGAQMDVVELSEVGRMLMKQAGPRCVLTASGAGSSSSSSMEALLETRKVIILQRDAFTTVSNLTRVSRH